MRKSKVLSVAMSSVLVVSIAAATSMSASALLKDEIKDHKVGATGDFNAWAEDVWMTDDDGDGIYQGRVVVSEVTEDMIQDWKVDDEPTGEKYLQFKVRLDGEWTDSWGNYEPVHDRCYNSQSNVPVKEAVVGKGITFDVFFQADNDPAALANPDSYAEEGVDDFNYYHVWYKVVEEEQSSEESSEEESSKVEESSKTEESSQVASETATDSTAPATGDATSAAALAAVVLASLGTAVVMTKKASAK